MNIPRFMAYTFLGSFLWSLGLAYGGFKLGENWVDLRAVMRPFDIPILVVLALLLALYIWRHLKHVSVDS